MNGSAIRYRSAINGAPCIAAVKTSKSTNRKTGDLVQVSFLASEEEPHHACKSGKDRAVCGNCPQRPCNGGACYVVTCEGPLSQYRAIQRERYSRRVAAADRPVRYGAYGDPASMSRRRFLWLHNALFPPGTKNRVDWSGYTHQWRDRLDLAPYLMASVDSEEEAAQARSEGWRYFRVREEGGRLLDGEIVCPSEKTDGKVKCKDCLLCCGNARRGPDIVITAHGAKAASYNRNGGHDG